MDSMHNKKIKITKTSVGNKVSDVKILNRGFSSSSIILNTKFKKRIEITPIPVNLHHKNIVNTFAAIDIETVENPVNSGNQTPIAISLVFKDLNNNMQKKFFINKDENQLFVSFFNYLNSDEFLKNNVKIIFAHNLGNFDGLFLLRGLLKVTDNIKDIDTLIDHHNKFILIKYKNIVFKDSFRIFPVSLNDLCLNFEVSGKIDTYNKEYNKLNMFNNPELLKQFEYYSINDSICLFNALIIAQLHYINHYQVDITTIYSTSTLSLRIFRQHHLLFPIPILEVNQDKFIRFSYFGGATDYYFVSLRYSKVVLFFIF